MQIVVIAAFITAISLLEASAGVAGPVWAAPAVLVYLLVTLTLGAANTTLSLREMAREPDVSHGLIRRHNIMTTLTQVWLIVGLAGTVLLGTSRAVRSAGLMNVPLADKFMVLLPFFAAVLLMWALEYPFHKTVRRQMAWRQMLQGQNPRPVWSLREYLIFNVRHHLLFVAVPVALILLLSDVLELYVAPRFGPAAPSVRLGGTVASAAVVFLLAPVMLVRIWQTRRLEDGPLRGELEDLCRRMKLRTRDIRIWLTGGVVANAGVMGLVGPVRYVLLSDALLDDMDDDQIKAIFAHEAGHIVHHHIFYAVLFALGSVVLCAAATEAMLRLFGADPAGPAQLWLLPVLAVVWGAGFGWISRRFERQSDVMAAWLVGRSISGADEDDDRITPEGAAVFARSLEKVAALNGIPVNQRNWRHGSIARRVEHVLWLGSTGGGRRDADRTVRNIKLLLWLLLVLSAVVVLVDLAFGGPESGWA